MAAPLLDRKHWQGLGNGAPLGAMHPNEGSTKYGDGGSTYMLSCVPVDILGLEQLHEL